MQGFIAFDLAIKVVEKLILLQEDLHRPILAAGATPRWIEASNIHLTLKFLGELDQSMTIRVRQAARRVAARHPIFDLDTQGVGFFPNSAQPGILWAGTSAGSEAVVALQADIEDTLDELGVPPDARPFFPRVTIGRMKTKKGKVDLEALIEPYLQTHFGTSQIKDIALFQSIPTSKGIHYKVVERYPLTG